MGEPIAKKSKSHYVHKPRNSPRSKIEIDLRGFLVSCNFQEKQCVRESYNILNRYADRLYPSKAENEPESDDGDLRREISDLKAANSHQRRFQVMDSGAKNFLFINTTLENPTELVEAIVRDIYETKQQQARFVLRLLPVERTTKAFYDEVQKGCETLIAKHFNSTPFTFSIMYNHRNNDQLKRETITKIVGELVSKIPIAHKVDLKNPEKTIVIEVIRNIAFLSVISDYYKYKKYNLLSLAETVDSEEAPPSGEIVNEAPVVKLEDVPSTDEISNETSME